MTHCVSRDRSPPFDPRHHLHPPLVPVRHYRRRRRRLRRRRRRRCRRHAAGDRRKTRYFKHRCLPRTCPPATARWFSIAVGEKSRPVYPKISSYRRACDRRSCIYYRGKGFLSAVAHRDIHTEDYTKLVHIRTSYLIVLLHTSRHAKSGERERARAFRPTIDCRTSARGTACRSL